MSVVRGVTTSRAHNNYDAMHSCSYFQAYSVSLEYMFPKLQMSIIKSKLLEALFLAHFMCKLLKGAV